MRECVFVLGTTATVSFGKVWLCILITGNHMNHSFTIFTTALAVVGGLYIRRRHGTKGYLLYLLFWLSLIAILLAVWRWVAYSALKANL